MIEENDPVNVLAALLKHSLEDVFDEKKYKDIQIINKSKGEPSRGRGKSRLFISFGNKDGINPRKLLKLINNETKIPAGRINEIMIKDSYSFRTVSFEDAETILQAFSERTGKKPLIQKADGAGPKPQKNKKKKK